jgi:methylphosphotriester-DNA--protein-cysteine methyltransferase
MKPIQELQVWIAENFHRELSLRILADRVAMSVRSFERVFRREVGKAPAQYVLQDEWRRRGVNWSGRTEDLIKWSRRAGFPVRRG